MSAATSSPSPSLRIPLSELTHFCKAALNKAGLSDHDAATVADALTLADSMGVFTHGTKLLAGYLNRLKGGGYRAQGKPKVERSGPAWAVVDGDAALGQVGGAFCVELAVQKAKQCGVAFVALRNTGHIGAAGFYSILAARAGMISMVTGNDIPSVAAPGSRGPVLGSNPIAYGIPVAGADPILLDMATAAVAGGKVYAACQRGEKIPPDWLIDAEGRPTTDGSLYPQKASLAPMAGHKGYGFGLWAEILSSLVPGGAMTWQVGSWMFDDPSVASRHNASFWVMDVETIGGPAAFHSRLQGLIDEIHGVATAQGVERVLIPGEREWKAKRDAQSLGVPLPEDVRAKLRQLGSDWSIAYPW